MCLLIITKENSRISNKSIKNAWSRNSDGGGYTFINKGKLETKKYLDLKSFKQSYNNDFKKHGAASKFLIHFRYATHGVNDISNVHPFNVSDSLAFAHNGVINAVADDDKLSDTRVFNRDILQRLENGFLNSQPVLDLMSEFIGHSKLVFLDNKNNFTIVNAELGHWNAKQSIWYSNDSYKKRENVYGNFGSSFNGRGYFRQSANFTLNDCETVGNCDASNKKTYAENSFLKCDYCGVLTDCTENKSGFDLCDNCAATDELYNI
tara:strand:- start:23306 stop:24097 length:792 start_codon:yes stop_codon:yes gene_type:complete